MSDDKILIELHYWHGDLPMMRRLVNLITCIEPTFNNRADVLLTARYDTPIDAGLVEELDNSFKTYLCQSPWVGEGEGNCYSWFASMNYVWHGYQMGRLPQYKAILTADADCVPLTRDWIDRLHNAWDSSPWPTVQLGAEVLKDQPTRHVNSNALWSGKPHDIKYFLNCIVRQKFEPWFDMLMAPGLRELGVQDCPGMRSLWRQPSMTVDQYQELLGEGVFFVHGVRDHSLLELAVGGMGISV